MTTSANLKLIEGLRKAKTEARATSSAAPTEKKEVALKPAELAYEDGAAKFSDIFGAPPSGVDHPVLVFKDEDWPEEVRSFIPEDDVAYIPDLEVLEVAHAAMNHNEPCLINGPKGTGKTDLYKYICGRRRIPYMRVNGRGDMDSSAIFGSVTVREGTMDWVDGPLAVLAKHGGFFALDEPSAVPACIALSLQWALEKNPRIYLADKPAEPEEKMVVPTKRFWIGATDNTKLAGDDTGSYVGTQPQNEALIDRFLTFVTQPYPTEVREKRVILSRIPDAPEDLVDRVLKFANTVRAAYDDGTIQHNISIRGTMGVVEKSLYWGSPHRAIRLNYTNKLADSDAKVVDKLIFKYFGKE